MKNLSFAALLATLCVVVSADERSLIGLGLFGGSCSSCGETPAYQEWEESSVNVDFTDTVVKASAVDFGFLSSAKPRFSSFRTFLKFRRLSQTLSNVEMVPKDNASAQNALVTQAKSVIAEIEEASVVTFGPDDSVVTIVFKSLLAAFRAIEVLVSDNPLAVVGFILEQTVSILVTYTRSAARIALFPNLVDSDCIASEMQCEFEKFSGNVFPALQEALGA
jgi:hypothetical protein